MNKHTQSITEDMGHLGAEARSLLETTADVTGERVGEARDRLTAALERGKVMYGRVREKAVQGAKATNKAVHEHPYQAIAIGIGVGALVGYVMGRRHASNHG